ncbi:hypothetical protein IMCC9480_345 [Oxalobacteraceae bacterium IMCC9480]|nr:hypothetical protein IMCC9480_345 [Oxalobacteraceae bacterium IMCC9480]
MRRSIRIRQHAVGMPQAVVILCQQIFGRDPLHAGGAGGKHALNHHTFGEAVVAHEQLLHFPALIHALRYMACGMLRVVVERFPDPYATYRIERPGAQQGEVGRLAVGQSEHAEQVFSSVSLRDQVIKKCRPCRQRVMAGIDWQGQRHRFAVGLERVIKIIFKVGDCFDTTPRRLGYGQRGAIAPATSQKNLQMAFHRSPPDKPLKVAKYRRNCNK